MPATRFFFWTVLLLFLTQNCGNQSPDDLVDPSLSESQIRAASLGDVNLTQPLVFDLERRQVEMDIDSGAIIEAENPNQEGFCLIERKRLEIESLLSRSAICRTEHEYSENRMCSQIYKFPYLLVFIADDEEPTPLGEETSGCPDQTTHLCSGDDILEGLFRSLTFKNDFEPCR